MIIRALGTILAFEGLAFAILLPVMTKDLRLSIIGLLGGTLAMYIGVQYSRKGRHA